ncbi:MAG TPA: diguanylate cyclase [Acidimicrobiales bacterium]|nr:diguanylate cyclase [Acidimicrobiales bacterium]
MVSPDEVVDETLQLARDLCIGTGAFFADPGGTVKSAVSRTLAADGGGDRLERLGRECLVHPAARGHDAFVTAEAPGEPDEGDRSLACLVLPVWQEGRWLGLLGVVGVWVPEPDSEQREGLVVLARMLAMQWPDPRPASFFPGDGPSWPADGVMAAGRDGPGLVVDDVVGPMAALLDCLEEGIVACDAIGTVILANRAARGLQGLEDGGLLAGKTLPATTHLERLDGTPVPADRHPLAVARREGTTVSGHFVCAAPGDRSGRHLLISARPLPVASGGGAIAVLRDMTAEWEEQAHLVRRALHDPLTGLANRHLVLEELHRMLQGLARRGGAVAVIYLDLDDFKRVNDEWGHDVGDELLRAVGNRLRGIVRAEDVVARLGGDEFVIAHLGRERAGAELMAARVRQVLSAPYRLGPHVVEAAASVGWASTVMARATPEALLRQADHAMYRDKRARRTSTSPLPVTAHRDHGGRRDQY